MEFLRRQNARLFSTIRASIVCGDGVAEQSAEIG
jgi:hypothetical protein